jgi:hypothetical protein
MCNFRCVFLCLFGKDCFPDHQSMPSSHSSTGVLSPSWIDSRMPGIDVRNKVSWIARQSSSEIRTAELLFPTIWMGSWDSFTSSTRLYKRFLASVAVKVGILILLYVRYIVRHKAINVKSFKCERKNQPERSDRLDCLCWAVNFDVRAASACNFKPNAPITLRMVSNPGLLSPDSALYRLSRDKPASRAT